MKATAVKERGYQLMLSFGGEGPDLSLATSTKSTAKQAVCTPHTVDRYYAAIQFENSRTRATASALRKTEVSPLDEHEVFTVLTSNCLY